MTAFGRGFRLSGKPRVAAAAAAEQECHEQAGHEPADVRHIGDAADVLGRLVRVGDGADAAEQLQDDPQARAR